MSIGIKWEKFLNVFPLESEFFVPTYDTPHTDATLSVVMQYFEKITEGNESYKMLNKKSQDISLYFQAEENGGTISCITHKQPTPNGGFTEHVAIAVLHMTQSPPDHISLTPHFVLTGEKRTILGQETLFPDAMACRVHHPEINYKPGMVPCDISNPDDISTGFCYAEDCFRRILTSQTLDVKSSEKWFEVETDQLNQRTSYITSRSQKQLHDEIKALEKQVRIENAASFRMPAPSAFQ